LRQVLYDVFAAPAYSGAMAGTALAS